MTRRHFEAVARVIANIADEAQRKASCEDMIGELRQFNPYFDSYKFRAACNVK